MAGTAAGIMDGIAGGTGVGIRTTGITAGIIAGNNQKGSERGPSFFAKCACEFYSSETVDGFHFFLSKFLSARHQRAAPHQIFVTRFNALRPFQKTK